MVSHIPGVDAVPPTHFIESHLQSGSNPRAFLRTGCPAHADNGLDALNRQGRSIGKFCDAETAPVDQHINGMGHDRFPVQGGVLR